MMQGMQGFIFGGNTGTSYADLQRKKAMAQQLTKNAVGQAPRNVGEGLNSIGQALLARRMNSQISTQESEGRAKAAEQFGQFAQGMGLDPQALEAMNNPYMSDGQNAIMQAAMKKKMEGTQRTKGIVMGDRLVDPYTGQAMADFTPDVSEVSEYGTRDQAARQYGLEPGTAEYQNFVLTGKMPSGSQGISMTSPDGTQIQIGGSQTGQGAFEKETGKSEAGILDESRRAAAGASELKSKVEQMRTILPKIGRTGPGGEFLGSVDDMIGILPGQKGARGAFRNLSMEAQLAMTEKTKGAITDREMGMFKAAVPNLGQTPEGNEAILDVMEAAADRAVYRVEAMEQYRQQNGTLQGFEGEWNAWLEANPLIVENPAGGIMLAGDAEGEGLPNGVTEEDIQYTMQKHGLSREEILQRLGAR